METAGGKLREERMKLVSEAEGTNEGKTIGYRSTQPRNVTFIFRSRPFSRLVLSIFFDVKKMRLEAPLKIAARAFFPSGSGKAVRGKKSLERNVIDLQRGLQTNALQVWMDSKTTFFSPKSMLTFVFSVSVEAATIS